MGVFSAVAGNQLPNQLKKSTTGSLPPAVPLAITPTFSPWTHTSDDCYIYPLSLVLATATVSFHSFFSVRFFVPFVSICNASGLLAFVCRTCRTLVIPLSTLLTTLNIVFLCRGFVTSEFLSL